MEKELVVRWLNDLSGTITIGPYYVMYKSLHGENDLYQGENLKDIIKKYWLEGMLASNIYNEKEKEFLIKYCA